MRRRLRRGLPLVDGWQRAVNHGVAARSGHRGGDVNCRWCGRRLVEVDNPFRIERRHRRGDETYCPGPPAPAEPAAPEHEHESDDVKES